MRMEHSTFFFKQILTTFIIMMICSTTQSLENPRYSVKRVQRLAKIPTIRLHGDLIPRTGQNSTRSAVHAKITHDIKHSQVEEIHADDNENENKNNSTKSGLHLPKLNSHQLKLRTATLSKGKPHLRSSSASTSLPKESTQELTTELPPVTTEENKGNNVGNKHVPLLTTVRTEAKLKSTNLPTRNRHINEKINLKRLVADSSQIIPRILNAHSKTTELPRGTTDNSSNYTTNLPQDTTQHETTTILTPTIESKRNSIINHINERVKTIRITPTVGSEKRTTSPRTIEKNAMKTNSSVSSQAINGTENIPKISTGSIRNKEKSKVHIRPRHFSSEFPKVTIANHHDTKIPENLSTEHETTTAKETSKITTTVAPQTTKNSQRKRYGQRNRGKATSIPQEISSSLYDLAISESDLKKTYKTAPTERSTREFKHRSANFASHTTTKFKPRGSEKEPSENVVETIPVNTEKTPQTTETITDFTEYTTNSVTEIPTTVYRSASQENETYEENTNVHTKTTPNPITTYAPKLTRVTNNVLETHKSTHGTNDLSETPRTTEIPEKVTQRPRGRKGRIVKVLRVTTTQPSTSTKYEDTNEITTYPTTLTETNSNFHEIVPQSSTSKSPLKRSQRPTKNPVTYNQDTSTETFTEFTISTTTLSNSSSEELNDSKVSRDGRRRGHRVVKMVRKIPIESDTRIYNDRYENESEKEIVQTSETAHFGSPKRVRKIIKINRKKLSDKESTTRIPATTLVGSEDYSATMTTNTDESSELVAGTFQDNVQSTYQSSDASTSLPPQEITIANDIFETTVSNTETNKDVVGLNLDVVTEKYRGRGRSRKLLLPDEIISSTTEEMQDTSSIKTLDYDTEYDEVQDDYVGSSSRNIDRELFISSGEDERHEQIQKRAADEKPYKRLQTESDISDPTRSQQFVSGSDSSRLSRSNKLYKRRLPSEYQAAANKYRTKYLSKFSRNYEQNRDRTSKNNFEVTVLNDKKYNSPYQRNNEDILDEAIDEISYDLEQTTLPSLTTYSDVKFITLNSKLGSSEYSEDTLNFQNDAIRFPSLERKITSSKETVLTSKVQKSSSGTEDPTSDEISAYKFQTKSSMPLKISLNHQFGAPPDSIKKISLTRTNLNIPSTAQKTISKSFKSTVPIINVGRIAFISSTKKPTSSSKKSSFKSKSNYISSTVSTVSSDSYRKNEFSTSSKQTVTSSFTKPINQGNSKIDDKRKNVSNQKIPEGKAKTPTFTEALTNKLLAAVQQVAGAVIELPKQLLLLPVRLGLYPGTERKQREVSKSVQFPCKQQQKESDNVPMSVHRLRPGDIKVVASLGDSFTTGNAALAENEEETRFNYRGVSPMGGGQGTWRQYLTVPNILKEFNPKLLGYALGTVESNNPISGLNVAENEALDDQILQQAQTLVSKIRKNDFIDYNNDWKLVNILIGSNDICKEYCVQNNDKDSPLGHLVQLEEALLYLKKNLPRTFVNLIHIPNIVSLRDMKNMPFMCHMKQVVQCSCLFGSSDNTKEESVSKMLQGYWQAERRVAEDERFDSEDFTVVLQPFFLGVKTSDTVSTLLGDVSDLSFFAPDCFHFSQKGNAQVANALWNNMLEPVGNKSLGWESPMKKFNCPSENAPYLFTRKNSQTFLQTGHQ